ncbi:MAG TPA: serine/threonine-protein kinase [Gemmatimonadaceae bacterium]|nr:serine/threonine-protein kinase [Gemmatimonadaceae bacterium]
MSTTHRDPVTVAAALAGHYRLEGELGHGGMATVYRARDLKHDRRVAVKVLRPELASAIGAERFLREIAIAARLEHPHILTLIDSGRSAGGAGEPDLLYYVMPFVDGESLRDRIGRGGPLPVSEAVRLLREIVDAIAFAHRRGVVHRDIKPDNVMLFEHHAMILELLGAPAARKKYVLYDDGHYLPRAPMITESLNARPLARAGRALSGHANRRFASDSACRADGAAASGDPRDRRIPSNTAGWCRRHCRAPTCLSGAGVAFGSYCAGIR